MPSLKSLADAAKNRAAEGRGQPPRAIRNGPNAYTCPFCGRHWLVTPYHGTSCSGFIASAAASHVRVCAVASPEERRAIARIDETRWRRSPPAHAITNNPAHPGFADRH